MSRDLKAVVEALASSKAWERPNWDGKPSRIIKGTVELGKHVDGKSTVELELTCTHHKDSKEYYAGLQIVSVDKTDPVFESRSYGLFNKETSGRLDRVPSPRYSAKALEAFWELQIGKLQDNPELLAQLNLDYNQAAADDDAA